MFDVSNTSFSSVPIDCGDKGGEPSEIVMGGGGEGVAELIDCCVTNAGSLQLVGLSGGSDIQIDACCIDSLCRS